MSCWYFLLPGVAGDSNQRSRTSPAPRSPARALRLGRASLLTTRCRAIRRSGRTRDCSWPASERDPRLCATRRSRPHLLCRSGCNHRADRESGRFECETDQRKVDVQTDRVFVVPGERRYCPRGLRRIVGKRAAVIASCAKRDLLDYHLNRVQLHFLGRTSKVCVGIHSVTTVNI
jgi:hypothetical protein